MKRAQITPAQNHPFQLPIVYVDEGPRWEYRTLVRNLAKEEAPNEEELNLLGADGWELAGMFTDSPFVYFYFKRQAGQ
jgi:hypothetical protein